MADMRPCPLLRFRGRRIVDTLLMRRTDVLPESPVQQHVPLWKIAVPHDGILTNRAPFVGPGFF